MDYIKILKQEIENCAADCNLFVDIDILTAKIVIAYKKALEHYTDEDIRNRLTPLENERLNASILLLRAYESDNTEEIIAITTLLYDSLDTD